MKIMHKPFNAVGKIEDLLEKDGKEPVDLAYASANENYKRLLIGIAYKRGQGKDAPADRNRYEIIVYDTKTDLLTVSTACLYYENALIEMGQHIRRRTFYENQ